MKNKVYKVLLALGMLILIPIAMFAEPDKPIQGYGPDPIPYLQYAAAATFLIMGYFLLRRSSLINIIFIIVFLVLNLVAFYWVTFALYMGHDPDGTFANRALLGLAVLVAISAYFLIYRNN